MELNVHILSLFVALTVTSVLAQNPSAYSSPHYAKKMYQPSGPNSNYVTSQNQKFQQVVPYSNRRNYATNSNEIASGGSTSGEYSHRAGNGSSAARSSFLETATSFLGGRGGQMLAEIAKEVISRSAGGSSQVGFDFDCVAKVLSLNLTNLVILVVLKALILGAGFLGAGAWKGGYGYGRSIDDNKNAEYITEPELLLYLSYLLGEQSGDYSCLQQTACQQHEQAQLYTGGADLLLQVSKMTRGLLPYNERYERIASEARQAAAWGAAGMPCHQRYRCGGGGGAIAG